MFRVEIIEELKRIEGLKHHYSEQLHEQTAMLQKLNQKSHEVGGSVSVGYVAT